MLKLPTAWQVFLAYQLQAATNSLDALLKKPLTTLCTAFVLALCLAVPTVGSKLGIVAMQCLDTGSPDTEVQVYLRNDLPQSTLADIQRRVNAFNHVVSTSLITPAEGLKVLEKHEGVGNLADYLDKNPLPYVLRVKTNVSGEGAADLDVLVSQLETMQGVDFARHGLQWSNQATKLIAAFMRDRQYLGIGLGLALVLVMAMTIELALRHREDEVRVLKLFGAPTLFILRPYLYTGLWYGLFAAALGVLFIHLALLGFKPIVQQLSELYFLNLPSLNVSLSQAYGLVFTGVGLCVAVAVCAAFRQLATIQPYK